MYLAFSRGGMSFFRHFVSPWLDYLIYVDSFEVMANDDHCPPALLAASITTAATSFGFDNIGTWPVGRVVVVAWICFAIACSYSEESIRSLTAMYYDGFVVQAGTETLSARHAEFHGP